MATKEVVTKVWIEEGCIVCDACETAAPDIFEVLEDTCIVRPDALTPDFTKPRSENITDAAEECPVDVIKFETVTEEVADEETAPSTGAAEPVAVTAEPAPAAQAVAAPEPAAAIPAVSAKPSSGTPAAQPAAARAVASAKTSMAGDPDPAIAALLRAATSRGGKVGILRRQKEVPEGVRAWQRKDPTELPPEARQAKIQEAARKARKDPDAQRRAFLSKAALTVGWTAFGAGAGVSVGPAFARFMMPNVLEEPDPRVRVGKLQPYLEMVPGDVIEDYKPNGIWMIRDADRLVALNIICTHLGCIPNWLPNDRKFKCPCHGSGFKPNGINFEGPTPRPLERFRIYIEDGIVIVDKSKKYQYELGQWDQPGSYIEV